MRALRADLRDETTGAQYYVPPDRYVATTASEQLAFVFESLPGLRGGTRERLDAAWSAVERLAREGR